jgi:hypothetical protein
MSGRIVNSLDHAGPNAALSPAAIAIGPVRIQENS